MNIISGGGDADRLLNEAYTVLTGNQVNKVTGVHFMKKERTQRLMNIRHFKTVFESAEQLRRLPNARVLLE